jgi:hypothetical protein
VIPPLPIAALLDWADEVPRADILVPFVAALFGGLIGAVGARHLRREELYVDAAQKINGYMDEAVEALAEWDPQGDFEVELVERVRQPVNLARFHSERLECEEVTNRLSVTGMVLTNIITNKTYHGRRWVRDSINDVMRGVIQFMKLPRFWPPWRSGRKIPEAQFPNTVEQYQGLATWDDNAQKVSWDELQAWSLDRLVKAESEKKA